MRSARIILASAAASAVLALTAPGAYAADGDWEKGDSSYSKKDESSTKEDSGYSKDDSSWSKEEDSGKEHDKDYGKPHGGVHTGGGALTLVTDGHEKGAKEWSKEDGSKEESWSKDDSSKESSWSKDDSSWSKEDGEDSWSGKDKPHGGVHTGGGALAAPGVTAGGLAVLAVAGAGLYGVRRKKSAHGLA
ncbi:hypothetical protein [Streptomyces griseoruber]|uniref:Gram-positive cocci surface proteins LPxTG domain-containing protein n=1 Tax=Streptomyces griseoruber TaxID=1943 RepID=A0A117RFW8_9ACTN|nr:hypothetical protein [Streptomyces griseoruber]KUN88601.1 hypothetical protein AQJ64_02695 [Streptomyces griseoruber]